MDKESLIKKIKKYKGGNVYVHNLSNKKNELDIIELAMADRILKNEQKNKKSNQKKEIKKIVKEQKTLLFPIKISNEKITDYFPNIFDYQIEGIRWLIKPKPSRWLLDEQGLGKTMQCIIAALIIGSKKNVIICPNFLKSNWRHEILKFTDDVQYINDSTIGLLKTFNIINYDSVHKYSKELILNEIDITIIDESQFVKKLESRRHLYTKAIANSSKRIWALTGTAKDNKLFDLFGQLQILRHELGNNKMYFGQRFCNTNEENPFDFTGAKNLNELHKILFSSVALRRTKEVLKNIIPDKIPNKEIFYDLDSFKEYYKLLKKYENKTKEENYILGGLTHLTEINILKQFLSKEKIKLNKELIDNILEEYPDEKIIIFSNYTNVINQYHTLYKDCSLIHDGNQGGQQELDFIKNEFNNNPKIKILICQYQNSYAGLNLQIANHTIVNELPQTPGIELQAKDRTHRPGQKYLTNYYYTMFQNTIDETLYLLFQEEHKISKNVIDGEENIINISLYKKLHSNILKSIIS